MSHVLQWMQFWALICNRWPELFSSGTNSYTPESRTEWSTSLAHTIHSLIHSQALIVQDGPLACLSGFLDHTHTDTQQDSSGPAISLSQAHTITALLSLRQCFPQDVPSSGTIVMCHTIYLNMFYFIKMYIILNFGIMCENLSGYWEQRCEHLYAIFNHILNTNQKFCISSFLNNNSIIYFSVLHQHPNGQLQIQHK
jgi:hypothetical protein